MIIETCENPKVYNNMWRGCGKCPKCKARKQREWTLRGKLEALENKNQTLFITLTYNDKNLKKVVNFKENKFDFGASLNKKDCTDFIKRLRKYFDSKKIKYIMCGEYGEKSFRPHMHGIIYGLNQLELTQKILEDIWKKGNVKIDPVISVNQIAYVVGYINKKITDKTSKEHYQLNNRIEPFMRASKGLGLNWSKKNKEKWTKTLKTLINGNEAQIPRYFIKKIFEAEGKKIKLENKITRINIFDTEHKIESHTSKYYKIFINPKGNLTQRILLNELKFQENSTINFVNKFKLDENKMMYTISNNFKERLEKIEAEWNDIKTLSDNELKKKYQHERIYIKTIEKQEFLIKNRKPQEIDLETWKQIQEEASIANWKTKKNAKRRAKLEINEELKNI